MTHTPTPDESPTNSTQVEAVCEERARRTLIEARQIAWKIRANLAADKLAIATKYVEELLQVVEPTLRPASSDEPQERCGGSGTLYGPDTMYGPAMPTGPCPGCPDCEPTPKGELSTQIPADPYGFHDYRDPPPTEQGEAVERHTAFFCRECGGIGWAFETTRSCNPAQHRHHGSHGGPVEVVEAHHYVAALQAQREAEARHAGRVEALRRERERAEAAEAEQREALERIAQTESDRGLGPIEAGVHMREVARAALQPPEGDSEK